MQPKQEEELQLTGFTNLKPLAIRDRQMVSLE